MNDCDYCDEHLPLYHKREGDESGLDGGDQFIPCQLSVDDAVLLNILSAMIDAGFSRSDVALVAKLGRR